MSLRNHGSVLILLLLVFSTSAYTTPQLSQHDPAVVHTVYGVDRFYNGLKHSRLTLNVSPYYQHTGSANKAGNKSSSGGRKVSLGNMEGPWNMAALFFNEAKPSGSATRFTNFDSAKSTLAGGTVTGSLGKNLSNESTFDLDNGTVDAAATYQDVSIKYEKMGIRGQLSFDLGFGLGMAAKGGIADYKQIPQFHLDSLLTGDDDDARISDAAKTAIIQKLMGKQARMAIARELELDLSEQRHTDIEDLHVSVYWHLPFEIKEKDEHVMTVAPSFSIGAWLPLGQERDQNKAFMLSAGNDGYAAITAEGSVALDFPQMIQLSIGAGASFYSSRDISNYRVPTSTHQVGIIPWKTTVNRQPGPMWYAHVSLKAENFSPGFSGYFDFIHTEHTRDTFVIKEANSRRKAKFMPELLEQRSAWKIQQINAGIKYDLTKHVSFGVLVQGTISGMRTYRTTSVLTSLIALF